MPRYTLPIAGTLMGLILLAIVGFSAWHEYQRANALEGEQVALHQNLSSLSNRLEALQEEAEADELLMGDLLLEAVQTHAQQETIETEMRAALKSRDVTISQLQGRLTVDILDRILFDSGEAVLKAEGEKLLTEIATVLSQHTNRQIHVIGHTDNIPIRASARSRFSSNWELSTARAISAVRYLQEHAGVDPHRLGAVGYGEFHPLASNATAEGRARNRRIAIVVLPEELAVVETADRRTNSTQHARPLPPPAFIPGEPSTTNAPPAIE